MKNLLYLILFSIFGITTAQAQSFTIVSPEGLVPPYEVSPGTEVTFRYDFFGEAPTTFFTHSEEPVFPGFGTDPSWNEYYDYTDNGDGTFNFTLTINEHIFVWGGFFAPFISQWNYTEVLEINIASGVVIGGDDLLLCDDGTDVELLTVEDEFSAYQWYHNGELIEGATSQTYEAGAPGSYYVQVEHEGEMINSNILNLSFVEISLTGALSGDNSSIILSTEEGMDSYQWLSGSDPENLSPIDGANASTYTATITSEYLYYAAEATINGCTVRTNARPVVDALFMVPSITVSADTNSYNVVCEDTPVTFSTSDNYSTYRWLRDGFDAYSENSSITVSYGYQEGNYSVEVSNSEWPEITITSESLELNYQDVLQPQLSGVQNYEKYCPGEDLNVILSDEGYTYNWYLHDGFNNYTEEDLIDVEGSIYSFAFDSAVYISVIGSFNGCENGSQLFLDSYENSNIFLSVDNWDQEYLCPDSSITVFIPEWSAGDYENFQWKQEIDGNFEDINGETGLGYVVTEPGNYALQATVSACPAVQVLSNEKTIRDYTERELFIWITDQTLCVGEEATINISGGFNWNSIQWFEETIEIGSMGYEETFTPIIGAGTETSLNVSEFNSYQVKAKHSSCPNGLKTTSNTIDLRPRVNPSIFPDPDYGINSWHVAPYDSIPAYVFCSGEPVKLNLDSDYDYDSYQWYTKVYAGDDDYGLGELIEGANQEFIDINAEVDWYTAVVDSAGCVGYSDPILIDTWVFLAPTITSYNNNELCEEGDSTLLHISFPGDWAYIEWYRNGELMPDTNNDTLWAKQPGMYTVTAYPTICPQFGYSSGVGPTVNYLDASIAENDSLIWALPQLGFYEYQWYLDGEPIESNYLPWAMYKDGLLPGEYTVAVTNPEPCTVISDPYVIVDTSTEDPDHLTISVYPNPTSDEVFIDSPKTGLFESVKVFNMQGKLIRNIEAKDEKIRIDLSRESAGLYLFEIILTDGSKITKKINRI
ncbi:MAG: T9SS C-terminal target domain-containing protein [Bacteroidetes bacterium]|nr:MAG: T9SS C-terminal target domain-containing protein [Bacteroidota bacterium]